MPNLSQLLKVDLENPPPSIVRLPGDASTRRYFRILSNRGSTILMKLEPFEDQGEDLPFLAVQRHLSECGIAVPQILEFDAKAGSILLEDLGDVTLLRRLQDVADEKLERRLYQNVLDELVKLQVNAGPEHAKTQMASFGMRFDFEKLFWEIEFTISNFYEILLQRKLAPADKQLMLSEFTKLCQFLADEPVVYTHRDFHSRNVMVCGDHLDRYVLIDFQDARMGPCQYDLVSLLKDSYYQLEESQIQALIQYFLDKRGDLKKPGFDRNHFQKVFDLMAVQRNFKAIGTFAMILNKRNNPTYLKYVGNTFENIRRSLLKHPEFSQLREVLFHYYYF